MSYSDYQAIPGPSSPTENLRTAPGSKRPAPADNPSKKRLTTGQHVSVSLPASSSSSSMAASSSSPVARIAQTATSAIADLPKPDFDAAQAYNFRPAALRCPDTPRRMTTKTLCAFMRNAKMLAEVDTLSWNGQKIQRLQMIGEGTYSNVYACQSNGALGSNYVLKIPRFTHLNMTSVRSVLVQYFQCRQLGINVADFANLNSFIADEQFIFLVNSKNQKGLLEYVKNKVTDGCYIVKFIHQPIAFWNAQTSFEIPTDPQNPWAQIKHMFMQAYTNRLPLDLKRTNVGIFQSPEAGHADNGKLFIFDLQEAEEDGECTNNPFALDINNCLNTFTDNIAVREYLDPRGQ